MAKSKTSTFVTELPLIVDSFQEKQLLSRFQAARQLYNACLSEAMARMNLVRNCAAYQLAKQIDRKSKKTRSDAFNAARRAYRYSDYDIQAYATIVSNRSKWIAQMVDSNTQQTIATRAFRASERVLFGRAKNVRYKVPSRFRSVEGKTNKQGIRWKNNALIWGKLKLTPIICDDNPVIQHGLNSPVKYVRLLWRELNGKRRWYVQLVNSGTPYQKEKNYVADGVIGLDLNIANIAFVGDNKAGLLPFADKVPTYESEIKALQRQMQRSQRCSNPENYEADFTASVGRRSVVKKGKPKKGLRRWKKSKTYQKIARKKRELERRKSAYAKSQNRRIVNEILRHGKHIKTENVSVKSWQKRYGKAISAKSPGFVQSELARKAESAGGSFMKFSTQKTALSQTHLTGERIKKKLSDRVHFDQTGFAMHRDLFAAYLGRFVNEEGVLLLHLAVEQWERSEPYLHEAWRDFQINRERLGASESRQSHSPLERFSAQSGNVNQIAIKGKKLT
ncbi:transposase [Microseira wollei]|uniref:Transposase, IS608 family protein n=1 Tax=Microseira wollei NIES-4236 TaxID=2530354 RepID=A0AAV3WJY9_9CYAN|nr:transposase [Microseira wollei]GET40674.1 transposase, IS608 family protein [Microseira wollei NIES-4236]